MHSDAAAVYVLAIDFTVDTAMHYEIQQLLHWYTESDI